MCSELKNQSQRKSKEETRSGNDSYFDVNLILRSETTKSRLNQATLGNNKIEAIILRRMAFYNLRFLSRQTTTIEKNDSQKTNREESL